MDRVCGRSKKGKLKKCHHGGERKSGAAVKYDFSVSLNPLGLPRVVKDALLSGWDIYEKYPDDSCSELCGLIARWYGCGTQRVVCGNGAADIIYRLCVHGGFKKVLLVSPVFSEYERALAAAGCAVEKLFMSEENGFVPCENDAPAIEGMLDGSYDALILCNPGNPAGGLVERNVIENLVKCCDAAGTMLVVDECFLCFVRDGQSHSLIPEAVSGKNVVVIRSFTKLFAMAGLRLGYAVFGSDECARNISLSGAAWSVSGPALAAGEAIMKEISESKASGADMRQLHRFGHEEVVKNSQSGITEYISSTVGLIEDEREYICDGLDKFGMRVVPGCANYVMFRGPSDLDKKLMAHDILIRNCSDYFYGELADRTDGVFFRIAVRTHEENEIFLRACGRCL